MPAPEIGTEMSFTLGPVENLQNSQHLSGLHQFLLKDESNGKVKVYLELFCPSCWKLRVTEGLPCQGRSRCIQNRDQPRICIRYSPSPSSM